MNTRVAFVRCFLERFKTAPDGALSLRSCPDKTRLQHRARSKRCAVYLGVYSGVSTWICFARVIERSTVHYRLETVATHVLVVFVRNRSPGLVWIEELHLLEHVQAIGPKVLLVDNA